MPAGDLTVSQLLARLESQPGTLPVSAATELLGAIIQAVAACHAREGAPFHGAITAERVILAADGSVRLTGEGAARDLQALALNRERLWREHGVALPPSASLPRFDQRADVTQVGVLGVALLLRRPLEACDYPRAIEDLLLQATSDPGSSALRLWLQQALQLRARGNFTSAVEAARHYAELPLAPGWSFRSRRLIGRMACLGL
ncbi:MAG: hypothetical protein AB7K63_13550 [Vicinamibacterales bacterium]